jgi:hypothetical protein
MRKTGGREDGKRSRTGAIEVCLSFNFVVIFNFNVSPFPPSEAQFLSNIPMNRQNSANCTDATMHLAPLKAMRFNFIASIFSKFYFADFFSSSPRIA